MQPCGLSIIKSNFFKEKIFLVFFIFYRTKRKRDYLSNESNFTTFTGKLGI